MPVDRGDQVRDAELRRARAELLDRPDADERPAGRERRCAGERDGEHRPQRPVDVGAPDEAKQAGEERHASRLSCEQAPRWQPVRRRTRPAAREHAPWISAGRPVEARLERRHDLPSVRPRVPRRDALRRQPEQERASVVGLLDPLDEAELDVARRPEEDGAQREAELARDLGRCDGLTTADDRDEGEILGRDARSLARPPRPAGPTCGTSHTRRGAAQWGSSRMLEQFCSV